MLAPEHACFASVMNRRGPNLSFYFKSGPVFFLLFTGRGVMANANDVREQQF
jgi:hypothetical protein